MKAINLALLCCPSVMKRSKKLLYIGTPKRTGLSREGWGGVVIWRAGAVGSAIYTAASVTCDWAGAVMKKSLAKRRKRRKRKWGTDRPTNRPTDQQTDTVTYSVA